MANIDITKTELVWPGKYNENGSLREVPRVNLPFQVIERVNESRATKAAPPARPRTSPPPRSLTSTPARKATPSPMVGATS